MIDDPTTDDDDYGDDVVVDDDVVDEALDYDFPNDSIDSEYDDQYGSDDNKIYEDYSEESSFDANDGLDEPGDDMNSGLDGTEYDLLQQHSFPEIPESQTLDTKALRGGTTSSGSSLLDPFGTGELFDESSAAASVALLGFLLVIIVGACVYSSFRQTMVVTPTHKNGANKQGKVSQLPSFSKRQE